MFTFLKPRYHKILIKILLFISLVNCQFQDPYLNHGINFLDNRAKKLIVSKSNLNDVVRIMGHPHTKSFSNENQWVYIERTLTKGEYHKLGKNVLICIRDMEPDENNPWNSHQVEQAINYVYRNNDNVKVMIIPDIESVNYGRGVGYEIIEHKPPEDIKKISATEIRKKGEQ